VHLQRATKVELVYWGPLEYELDVRAGSVDVEDLLYVQPLHAICSTKCGARRAGEEDDAGAAPVALSMRVYPGFSEIEMTVTDRIEWEWNPDTILRARGLWTVRDDFELVSRSAGPAAPLAAGGAAPQPQPLDAAATAADADVDAGAGAAADGVESTFVLTFTSPVDLRLNKERQNRCLAVFASERVSMEFKIGRTGTIDMVIVFDGLVVTDAAGRVIGARARAEGGNAAPDGASRSASEAEGRGAARGTRCAISYSDDLARYHTHVEIGALFLRYYHNTWLELVEYISYGVVSAPFISESGAAEGGESAPDDAAPADAEPNWATFSMSAPVLDMFIPAEEASSSGLLVRAGAVTFTNEPREVERVASGMGTAEDEREATLVRSLWVIRSVALNTTAPAAAEEAEAEKEEEMGATRRGRRSGSVCADTDVYMLSEFVYEAVEGSAAAAAVDAAPARAGAGGGVESESTAPPSRTFVTALPQLDVRLTPRQAVLVGAVFTANLAAADEPPLGAVTFDEILEDVARAEGKRPPKAVPDEASKSCMLCRSPFSAGLVRRRCASCGSLVCVRCSAHRVARSGTRASLRTKEGAPRGAGAGAASAALAESDAAYRFCDCCFPFLLDQCASSPLLPPASEWHGEWTAVQYPYEQRYAAPTPFDFRCLFPALVLTVVDVDGTDVHCDFAEVDYNVARLSRDRQLSGFVAARGRVAARRGGEECVVLERIGCGSRASPARDAAGGGARAAAAEHLDAPPQLCVRHNALGTEISDVQINGDHCRIVVPTDERFAALLRYFSPPSPATGSPAVGGGAAADRTSNASGDPLLRGGGAASSSPLRSTSRSNTR
jgi:hypothetical protein